MELDIRKLIEVIANSQLIKTNTKLVNFVNRASTEPEVAHDLLHTRIMGQKDYEYNIISSKILASLIKKKEEKITDVYFCTKKENKEATSRSGDEKHHSLWQASNSMGKQT